MFTLTIEPKAWECKVGKNETLLKAAATAGLRLPSSCRNGTCRACMCKLLKGAINHQIEWPGLSNEEKSEGWILPCVAVPLSDITIHAVNAKEYFAVHSA